jgi:inorganic pyrophosphatase
VEVKGWHDAAYARDQVIKAVKQFEESKAAKAEPVTAPVKGKGKG